jgi:hypothetical protein
MMSVWIVKLSKESDYAALCLACSDSRPFRDVRTMEGRDGYEPMGGDNQLDHVIAQPLADGRPAPAQTQKSCVLSAA